MIAAKEPGREKAMPLDDEAARRFDQQDNVLREILDGMAEHREYHKLTDPGVSEMVDILKGAKAVKVVVAWFVGVVAVGFSAWAWIVDHVKVIK